VAVVRRRDDPIRATDALKGTPTVVRAPPNSSDAVLQRYDLLASTGATCDPTAAQCYTSLASLMDVDQFVRYIALFTWLGCGDYIDETYFVSSAELDGAFLWRLNSWDTVRLFSRAGSSCVVLTPAGRLLRVGAPPAAQSRERMPPFRHRCPIRPARHHFLLRGRS